MFFGASGDLAYKEIFPALLGLVQRNRLDVPIIGVARSGWDLARLRRRARESVEDDEWARYVGKYEAGMRSLDYGPETFRADYSVPLRVTPLRFRGW